MNSKPSPEADSQKRARAQGQQAYLGHPGQLPLLSLPWATTKYYLLRTESEGSTRGSCNPKEQAQPSRQPATRYSCQKVPPASHPHRKQSGKLRPNGISSASDSCQGFQTYTHTHNHLYSMCVEPPRSLLMKTRINWNFKNPLANHHNSYCSSLSLCIGRLLWFQLFFFSICQ